MRDMETGNVPIGRGKQDEELFAILSHSSPIGIYIVQGGKFQFVNQQFQKQTGYGEDELLGMDPLGLVLPADKSTVKENAIRTLKGECSLPYEYRVIHKDGTNRWIMETVAPVQYKGRRAALGNFMDVTERKQTEELLQHSLDETAHNQRLLLAFGYAAQAVHRAVTPDEVYKTVLDEVAKLGYNAAIFTLTDDGEHLAILHMTFHSGLVSVAEKLVGLSAQTFRLRLAPGTFYQQIIAEQETIFRDPFSEVIAEALPAPVRILAGQIANLMGIKRGIGAPLVIDGNACGLLAVSGIDLSEADVPAINAFGNQIAVAIEKSLLIQRIQELAITDGLTGLYNHRHFHELLADELKRSKRYQRSVSLVMADIDHFKEINDSCGHQTGDEVLKSVTIILRGAVRATDHVARYGGEEFVIILPETSEEEASATAERIRQSVEDYDFKLGSHRPRLTLSLGVASAIAERGEADDLIYKADCALYQAKQQGRNRVCSYSHE